jgi:metal-dependent amidase/aminoacylase/carboxypeptidase family protein
MGNRLRRLPRFSKSTARQTTMSLADTTEPYHVRRKGVVETVVEAINAATADLTNLALDLHAHPELCFQEHYAHDALTAFMAKQAGFTVERHICGLETAWSASFEQGRGGPCIGFNSEMDALPGLGHACGHQLIAIGGVAMAVGVARALREHDIAGRVLLLGTPAEEDGGGKVVLLEQGAYKSMAACLMCAPSVRYA